MVKSLFKAIDNYISLLKVAGGVQDKEVSFLLSFLFIDSVLKTATLTLEERKKLWRALKKIASCSCLIPCPTECNEECDDSDSIKMKKINLINNAEIRGIKLYGKTIKDLQQLRSIDYNTLPSIIYGSFDIVLNSSFAIVIPFDAVTITPDSKYSVSGEDIQGRMVIAFSYDNTDMDSITLDNLSGGISDNITSE